MVDNFPGTQVVDSPSWNPHMTLILFSMFSWKFTITRKCLNSSCICFISSLTTWTLNLWLPVNVQWSGLIVRVNSKYCFSWRAKHHYHAQIMLIIETNLSTSMINSASNISSKGHFLWPWLKRSNFKFLGKESRTRQPHPSSRCPISSLCILSPAIGGGLWLKVGHQNRIQWPQSYTNERNLGQMIIKSFWM